MCPPVESSEWACSSVVEHLTFNQRVSGSNPDGLTKYFRQLERFVSLSHLSGVWCGVWFLRPRPHL